jgi:hypothetical protein
MRVLNCRPGPAAGLLGHADYNVGDPHFGESGDVMDQLATQYFGIESLRLFEVAARKTDMMQVTEAGTLMLCNSGSILHGSTPPAFDGRTITRLRCGQQDSTGLNSDRLLRVVKLTRMFLPGKMMC